MTMTKGQLHPSVQRFKEFVRNHPKMVQDVRNGAKTWQQFYEEWYLLGEKDAVWHAYEEVQQERSGVSTPESADDKNFMGQMMSFIKNIKMDDVQSHLANFTNTIGSVQQVIQQFQGKTTSTPTQPQQNNPFFQKD